MNIDLKFTVALRNHIVDKFSNPLMGARPLRRGVMVDIEDPLASEILSGNIEEGDTVKVSFNKGKVNFH